MFFGCSPCCGDGGGGGCRLPTTSDSIAVNVSMAARMASVDIESGATGFNITNDIPLNTYSLQFRGDSYGSSLAVSSGTTNNFNDLVVVVGPTYVQLTLISTNFYEYFPNFVGVLFILRYQPCGDTAYISKSLRMIPDVLDGYGFATQTITRDTATHDQNAWVSTHQIGAAEGFYFNETNALGSSGVTTFVPLSFSAAAFTQANSLGSYTHEFDFTVNDILVDGSSVFLPAYYF